MTLVAGVDSSTQSCTIVVRDAASGRLVRFGSARHPDGTEVDPDAWWAAFLTAADAAGGLADVAALGVAGQQHGMVALDDRGDVVRPALLWNDTRSARAAADLIGELGGPAAWADAVGTVPVASLTVSKLRWLRDHEPGSASRVAAVALPHDWLSWKVAGLAPELGALATDRSDASGTGYWSPRNGYRSDLLELALGRAVRLPQVLGPAESVVAQGSAAVPEGTVVSAGAGDNAGAALGLGMRPGDVAISIGTSGVVCAVSAVPTADALGQIAGFADATGEYLPLVCTLNAARVLDAACRMQGVRHDRLAELALSAPPGADGLTLVPYLEGERTPNRPNATGTLYGLCLSTATPAHLARAAVEGMLCGLADGLDALRAHGVGTERLLLIGGGARSEAVRRIAPQVFGMPVEVPEPGEYVADGAARQAAWALSGSAAPPRWTATAEPQVYAEPAQPHIRERYAAVRDVSALPELA
jgi:xylulokinase